MASARLRRFKRHSRRRLRRLRLRLSNLRFSRKTRAVLLGFGVLLALGAVWLVVTGLFARSQLKTLQGRLSQVKVLVSEGRVADARTLAKDIPAMAERAHRLTTGPAWWLAAGVPYFGDPLDVVRGTTAATQRLGTDAVPKLLDVAALIDPSSLRVNGHTIRIDKLAKAAPQLARAAATLDEVTAEVSLLPSDTWFSTADNGRNAVQRQLTTIRGYVDAAARAAKVLPAMLGDHGTKRYFIGLQNESELRGTGGLPGAFAIARVRDGTITFEQFESDAALFPPTKDHEIKTGLNFGASYDALYGPSSPTTTFVDSNVSPHFPYAARIWAAMWEKLYRQHIDGVLAVDPTALAYFLAATGPTAVPGEGVISADNVVSLTERDAYALFPDNSQRKAYLVSVLKAAAKRLTSGAGAPFNIIAAAGRASSERRLLAWSSDPAVESLLEQTNYAGAIPGGDRPFAAVILNNAAAGKLDYYLARTLNYSRTGCGSQSDVVATITLTNSAPAAGLPMYVTGRADKAPHGAKPGDSRVLLDYYASRGAQLESVTRNGAPSTASVQTTLDHAVFRLDLELPRGTTQTIVLHLREPAGRGSPLIWRQPGVTTLDVRSFDQRC